MLINSMMFDFSFIVVFCANLCLLFSSIIKHAVCMILIYYDVCSYQLFESSSANYIDGLFYHHHHNHR